MRILAIETSCDETAMALVNATGGLSSPKFKIEENVVSSQIAIHRPFGGVVPNLAKREHIKNLPIVLSEIFGDTRENIIAKDFKKVDMISVTVGPGLEPALWTGIEFAKELHKEAKKKNKKLLLRGVNHMEGHLYSFLLQQKTVTQKSKPKIKNMFPSVALVVSGGHTILLLLESLRSGKNSGRQEMTPLVRRLIKLREC